MPSSRKVITKTQSFGAAAEEFVAQEMARKGWNILARNYRRVGCEIDLIAEKADTLVIVEVKNRQNFLRSCSPEHLLPWRKRQALLRGAQCFLANSSKTFATIRFDLAVVAYDGEQNFRLKYFPNVFENPSF